MASIAESAQCFPPAHAGEHQSRKRPAQGRAVLSASKDASMRVWVENTSQSESGMLRRDPQSEAFYIRSQGSSRTILCGSRCVCGVHLCRKESCGAARIGC